MDTMRGMVSGALNVDRDINVRGIVRGDVLVAAGCAVEISGIVSGDVILAPDATASVSGILSGQVIRR